MELAGTDTTAGSVFSYPYTWTADVPVFVTVIKLGFRWLRIDTVTLGAANQSIPIFQQADPAYNNPP
jgi:hypothetical protein